jgi:hypothetical protein
MDTKFEQLGQDDILSLHAPTYGREFNVSSNNFASIYLKSPEFIEVIKRRLSIGEGIKNSLFANGLDSEVLRVGKKAWQKGKVRINVSVEFCPDEPEIDETAPSNEIPQPESPLDDIRQMMNQENQQL